MLRHKIAGENMDIMFNSAAPETPLKRILDLFINLSGATGGCIMIADQHGGLKKIRKKFTREAFREVSERVGKEKTAIEGPLRLGTSGGSLILLQIGPKNEVAGYIVLEFRGGTKAPHGKDVDILCGLASLLPGVTALSHSRDEVRRKLEEYKKVFEKAPIGILVFDRKGNLTSINPFHTARLRGRESKNLLQSANVFKDESIRQARLHGHLRKLLEGESFELYNHPFTTKIMRKKVFVDVRGVPLIDEDGRVDGGIVLISNVTEKAKLEEELRASRDYLTNILDSVDSEVMVVDRDYNIELVNEAIARKFALNKAHIKGMKCFSVLHGKSFPCRGRKTDCPVEDVFADGASRTRVHQHEGKHGPTTVEVHYSPMKDSSGRVMNVIVVAQDVTERKALEQKYRNREALLANISSDSADAIFSLDNQDRITSWNIGARRIFGYEEKHVIGKSIELLIPDEERKEQLREMRKRVYGVGFVRNFEARWVTRHGQEVDIIITRTALKDENGDIVGSSIVIKDITRLKNMAKELLHVEKLAVLGKMSATVAHEIRNPLGSITLNLDLLEEEIENLKDDGGPMIAELISSIRSEIKRLSLLSDDYLRFTRYPKLNITKVSLEELVNNAIGPYREQFASRGIELKVIAENGSVMISIDEHQAIQALRNLLINASEATPAGGMITVRFTTQDSVVVIQVSDTGTGIKSSELPLIFDPFFTTKEKGTGLGLSIVKQVTDLHGGKVECESRKGEGSTFTLYFPVDPQRGGEDL